MVLHKTSDATIPIGSTKSLLFRGKELGLQRRVRVFCIVADMDGLSASTASPIRYRITSVDL